jgi:ATP-dependent DNA helicase 2 subunit 1
MNDLVIKQAPKRVQFSIPLKIGGKDGDIEIGISGYVSTGIAYTGLISRYALVSEQGKGQPKSVRMRGQTVEEVVTRSEYTSAVS